MIGSQVQTFFDQIGIISRAEKTSQRNCPVQATLMHDRCWFCACAPCMSDVLFLIDQSALVDPIECRSALTEFDIDIPSEDGINNFNRFEGSRKQIDFVMDTVRQLYYYVDPKTKKMENIGRINIGAVRIAVAIYGDSSNYDTLVDFNETFSQEVLLNTTTGLGSQNFTFYGDGFIGLEKFHCKLYGYTDEDMNDCLNGTWVDKDGSPVANPTPSKLDPFYQGRPGNFMREPLCGTGGLKDAMVKTATFEEQNWRHWDPHFNSPGYPNLDYAGAWQYDFTTYTPISKILAMTAGGPFVGTAFENEQELLSFMRPLHDPIEGGFDFIFPVGMFINETIGRITYTRSPEEERQYWRGLNIIGCLTPESCDYALMASPSNRDPDNAVDPANFVKKLFQDSFWDKFFCYYRSWNYFCEIEPYHFNVTNTHTARNRRAADSYDTSSYPNSCCNHVPYNSGEFDCCPGEYDPQKNMVKSDYLKPVGQCPPPPPPPSDNTTSEDNEESPAEERKGRSAHSYDGPRDL